MKTPSLFQAVQSLWKIHSWDHLGLCQIFPHRSPHQLRAIRVLNHALAIHCHHKFSRNPNHNLSCGPLCHPLGFAYRIRLHRRQDYTGYNLKSIKLLNFFLFRIKWPRYAF